MNSFNYFHNPHKKFSIHGVACQRISQVYFIQTCPLFEWISLISYRFFLLFEKVVKNLCLAFSCPLGVYRLFSYSLCNQFSQAKSCNPLRHSSHWSQSVQPPSPALSGEAVVLTVPRVQTFFFYSGSMPFSGFFSVHFLFSFCDSVYFTGPCSALYLSIEIL